MPHFDVCVANIPYQISSLVVGKLLSHRMSFRSAVLMVQEEFAHRLMAKPGTSEYSRLSVSTSVFADVDFISRVSRDHFQPPPKVDSSVIRVIPRFPRVLEISVRKPLGANVTRLMDLGIRFFTSNMFSSQETHFAKLFCRADGARTDEFGRCGITSIAQRMCFRGATKNKLCSVSCCAYGPSAVYRAAPILRRVEYSLYPRKELLLGFVSVFLSSF